MYKSERQRLIVRSRSALQKYQASHTSTAHPSRVSTVQVETRLTLSRGESDWKSISLRLGSERGGKRTHRPPQLLPLPLPLHPNPSSTHRWNSCCSPTTAPVAPCACPRRGSGEISASPAGQQMPRRGGCRRAGTACECACVPAGSPLPFAALLRLLFCAAPPPPAMGGRKPEPRRASPQRVVTTVSWKVAAGKSRKRTCPSRLLHSAFFFPPPCSPCLAQCASSSSYAFITGDEQSGFLRRRCPGGLCLSLASRNACVTGAGKSLLTDGNPVKA